MTFLSNYRQNPYRTTTTFTYSFTGIGSTTIYVSTQFYVTYAEAFITNSNVPSASLGGGPLYFGAGPIVLGQSSSDTEKVASNISSYAGIGTSLRSTVGFTDRYFGSGVYLSDAYIDNANERLVFTFTKATTGSVSLDARGHIVMFP